MSKDSDAKSERNISIGGDAIGSTIVTGDHTQIIQPAPFTPPALHQLPPPSADFVGREKEMTELLQALEIGGATISGLQGMGGIGKTALALKLAEQLKPKYPDAQFYLDLKGASKEPLTSAQAMTHIIRSYHPEAKLPDDQNGLQGLYLSLLDGKKTLLLMDNAASAEQVKPLIPPSGSVMLITSRNHFTLSGFFVKNLETLDPGDAKQLLLKIAPRIGENAEKIAQLCGYLPLALEVAASSFLISVSLTPEAFVVRFSDTLKRLELLDMVRTSLLLSYELLDDEMQKYWRVLSVFPNTFDANAVASLWEIDVEKTENNLDKLVCYSLVEWNETTRRYRLHDLVRMFADSRLDNNRTTRRYRLQDFVRIFADFLFGKRERFSAKKAHAVYYQNFLLHTKELYLKGGQEMVCGLALFDLERENIEAGQRWAASLIGKDKSATELSIYYFDAGIFALMLRFHPREEIIWLEAALKAAHLLKDKHIEGAMLGNLGLSYKALGEIRKAIQFFEQHLEIARKISDFKNEGNALGNLGNAYLDLGEIRKAIQFFEQALIISRKIGYRKGEGITLCNLGGAYTDLGDTDKAIECCEQSLLISREIGDRKTESDVLGNLGNVFADLGETGKFIEYTEQALLIVHEMGNRRSEGIALFNLGNAYRSLGEPHKAIELYAQALIIAQEIGYSLVEGDALWNTALVYYQFGDIDQAISFAENALPILEQIESPMTSVVRLALEEWKAEQV